VKRSDNKPLVYLISAGTLTSDNYASQSEPFLELIRQAVSYRIQLVQIREKQLSSRNLFDLSTRVKSICDGSNTRILINDRVDIALATQADGVHHTAESVRPEIVRKFVPASFMIGVSTHSVNELVSAKAGGADFAVFGPVYATAGKTDTVGIDGMRLAVEQVKPFDVLALGGIDTSNYHDVLDAGAAGFAAIRFLNDAENLRTLSQEFGL